MKYLIYVFLGLAVVMLIFCSLQINFDDPLDHDSKGALIGVLTAACVIVLMLILLTSRAIAHKIKNRH